MVSFKSILNVLRFAPMFGALAVGARGQTTLLGWDMAGTTESAASLTAATFGSHISNSAPSGVLSRGAGAGSPGNVSADSFGAAGFTATTLDNALSANDYFAFSITADSGFTMTLASIAMKLFDTTNGPTSAAIFSSVGGFGSSGAAIQSFTLTGNANNDQSITLSAGSFSNLTGSVEFRIYAYGGTGSFSTDKLRFRSLSGNDLTLNGAVVAVPEPATVAVWLGLGAMGAALVWRRRGVKRSRPIDHDAG